MATDEQSHQNITYLLLTLQTWLDIVTVRNVK